VHRPVIFTALAIGGCTCSTPPAMPRDTSTSEQILPTSTQRSPTGETGAPLSWVEVGMGYIHGCGLLSDGRVVCWGDDDCQADAPASTERFVQISVGPLGGCYLREDGSISCSCCRGYGPDEPLCQDIPQGRFVEVRVGAYDACAMDESRRLHCWGSSDVAQPTTEPLADFQVEDEGACGVTLAGDLVCWGRLLWEGFDEGPPEGVKFTRVTTGRAHACALGVDQEIYCWGIGYNTSDRPPLPFPDPSPGPYVDLQTFNVISCGMRPDSSLECWFDFPPINGGWILPDERFRQFDLGEWDACGVTVDGRALCWPEVGFDTEGEISEVPSLEDL
jgi:hypothetical protein